MVVKIDLCNMFVTEKDVIETVSGGWTECNRIGVEGFADLELNTVEGDLTMISHFTHDVIRAVGNGR